MQKHTDCIHTGLKGLWEQLFGCYARVREGSSKGARHETAKKQSACKLHLTMMMLHKTLLVLLEGDGGENEAA